MERESGQATVEWVGLVLIAALALGGLTALGAARAPAEERELSEELAKRILPEPAARRLQGAARVTTVGAVAPVGAVAAVAPAAPRRRARLAGALRPLRGLKAFAKHAWIVCLGYHRWRYELEHPRVWNEPLPLEVGLRAAGACLNPYAFLTSE